MEPLLVDLVDVHAEAARTIASVGADQWSLPTPCEGWSVADLVRHQVVGQQVFAALLRGEPVERPASLQRWDAELRERETPELPTVFVLSARDLERAYEAPDVKERSIALPIGDLTWEQALHLRLAETLVHAWDLARTIDRLPLFADRIIEREIDASRRQLETIPEGHPAFGPPVAAAADAPALDRLAALLGRTP